MSEKITFYAIKNINKEIILFPEEPSFNNEVGDFVSQHGSFKIPKTNKFSGINKKINERIAVSGPIVKVELFMAAIR
jgi:hypothetical protein